MTLCTSSANQLSLSSELAAAGVVTPNAISEEVVAQLVVMRRQSHGNQSRMQVGVRLESPSRV